jgi:urea transport system permease protein
MTPTDIGAALSNSLSVSSLLILTAIGLAITFGVMRVINMAHGEMLMLGGYTAHVVSSLLPRWLQRQGMEGFGTHLSEYGLYYAIPISFIVVGFIGFLLEVGLIRFLYGRPLDTLLATWGVSLIIQQVVNLTFGANLRDTHLPSEMQGYVEIGDLNLPKYRLFIVGITAVCLLSVYWWFFKTSFGLKIRAVVQNRPMASALGISTRRVDALTFAFATGLAGVAGCIVGNVYDVSYTMGDAYIVESFMVVILGGMGRLGGTIAAGTLIGFSLQFLEKYLSKFAMSDSALLAKVIILGLVITFLLIRPSGLLVTKERTYD